MTIDAMGNEFSNNSGANCDMTYFHESNEELANYCFCQSDSDCDVENGQFCLLVPNQCVS